MAASMYNYLIPSTSIVYFPTVQDAAVIRKAEEEKAPVHRCQEHSWGPHVACEVGRRCRPVVAQGGWDDVDVELQAAAGELARPLRW